MKKIRNAVVIIILCIIGSYSLRKRDGGLTMPGVGQDLQDAVANNRVPTNASRPPLNFRSGGDDDLRDSVANNPVDAPPPPPGDPDGNTDGSTPPPPRGNGAPAFTPSGNQPGPNVSPSGPESEEQPQ